MTVAERTTATELAEQVLATVEGLRRGEIAYVTGARVWIGRAASGRLRVGFGDVTLYWPRGDAADMLCGHVETHLDWTQMGYLAMRYRNAIEVWLERPDAYRATGIGRVTMRVDRESRRLLSSASREQQATGGDS